MSKNIPRIIVLPSMLAADPLNLERDLRKVKEAEALHVDIMSPDFVPNLSFGTYTIEQIVKRFPDFTLDVHLMMNRPAEYIDRFYGPTVGYMSVHAESYDARHADRLLHAIKDKKVKAGVAFNPGTDPFRFSEYIIGELADFVLVMTVNPGDGGQQFIPQALENVRRIREKYPSLEIEVDGGIGIVDTEVRPIDESTAYRAGKAGANMLVAGSAVFKAKDYKHVIEEIWRQAQMGHDDKFL